MDDHIHDANGYPLTPGLRRRRPRRPGPLLPALAALAIVLGAGASAVVAGRPRAPLSAAPAAIPLVETEKVDMTPADPGQIRGKAARAAVEKLIEEQKFEAAAAECARVRGEARRNGDTALWTWSLIREGQLRVSLHGYETAVRFFKDEAWPDSPVERDLLELFYANSLVTYYRAYSWEINRRETVESKGPVDLKSWTRDQIFAEAWSALLRAWKDRDRLAARRAAEFPDFWEAGDYPAGVRDNLRDAVVYLMAGLISDTTFWTPRQSNETWLVDLPKLLSGAGRTTPSGAADLLASASAHPVEKAAALLGEHESWSRRGSRPAAALEARLALVQALYEAFSDEDSRALVRGHLAAFLAANRRDPWWATGQALLAEYTRAGDDRDALVRARRIALEGLERFPGSPGGLRCRHIVESIEAPEFTVDAMGLDAPGRRSIRVRHRNLDRIFFRAYPLDLEALLKTAKDYSVFPQGREALKIIEGPTAASAAWQADLARTADYRDHSTYADLPAALAPGLYLLAASARQDFAAAGNQRCGFTVVVGDLALVNREGGGLSIPIQTGPEPARPAGTRPAASSASTGVGEETLALSGATGKPLAGVTVDLYAFDWRKKGHTRIESKTTGEDGRVWFAAASSRGSYFLLAKKGRDIAFDPDYVYFQDREEPHEDSHALLYTDRSIYRPGQKLYWKILAYRGRQDIGRLSPAAGAAVSVWLEDVNGQRVAEATASTNAFGTASGEFAIPAAGRPLGGWHLRSSPSGWTALRVEEYKRPTFEVSVKDPDKPLRLNRPAALKAEARYYFGLPVASGQAVWQVRREPVYPRWWWWDRAGSRSQVVAGGRAAINADGTIELAFTPRADEKKDAAASGVSYRYTLTVDVTDEGGETRSAERSFRLGFVNVEARVNPESAFLRATARGVFTASRTDLDGVPKAGQAAWRIVRLVEPDTTLLPADQPVGVAPGSADPAYPPTPGDLLRPRWVGAVAPDEILRLWKEGAEAARGTAEHDAKGAARIEAPGLAAGAYRLLYETKDDFGAVCRDSLNFLVVGEAKPAFRLPLVLRAEKSSVTVGGTVRFLVDGGWTGQPMLYETFKGGEVWERRWIEAGKDGGVIEIPVVEGLRGGFGARLAALRDHQFMSEETSVYVPWDNKELGLSFSTFRDKLAPGGRETWRVTVKTPKGTPAEKGAAELLAYMYDRSLDIFAPHRPPQLSGLYPNRMWTRTWFTNLGQAQLVFRSEEGWQILPGYPSFQSDELLSLGGYGIGGPGSRFKGGVLGGVVGGALGAVADREAPLPEIARQARMSGMAAELMANKGLSQATPPPAKAQAQEGAAPEAGAELRSNFAETAFWQPHLLTGADGTATIEFTVPDSVTSWRVFVHGLTRDLAGGTLEGEARSVKDLMVRPYLPRFFREGDKADLRVMVNNAGAVPLSGEVTLEITDPATGENLAPAFGLPAAVPARAFKVEPGGGTPVAFALAAPARVGTVAFKVTARSGVLSDGELRPLPVLPGRMHLVQSRFATLREGKTRELRFDDMARADDPTRLNEQLVVTIDAQLFYGLIEALPYLVNYPYECTEQTLNRFLSTGILTSLYDKYPSVARMARELGKRETVYETFDAADANRKMALEETPWLETAQGGRDAGLGLEKVLDPRVARAQREASLAKLLKAQTSLGAFPWWPGGPPSPYMTLYIVSGLAKAVEFGVDVPKAPVVKAFGYLHRHYLDEIAADLMAHDAGWEFVTFLNYVIGNFPDASWTGGVFKAEDRAKMLDFSFRHWKEHSPYLKGYLALTLKRAGRAKDAELVWDSVMDSAKTTEDGGTSWAPEDRGWLWYNDTIETHAFALRTLLELAPGDARGEGLVQWLFLNKKLNHWKSTRATAEVLYSVAWYLKKAGALAGRETVTTEACGAITTFTFEPDKYTGKKNQLVIAGDKLDRLGPACAMVKATKGGKGLAFASATWHFSTERMPEKGEGDLFAVERTYFRREKKGQEVVLRPLAEGAALAVGDEIEVHLSIRARHQAEYVHLRDPRPSGCEPAALTSGYRWDLGLGRYEEIRDSGTNFFMEWLPEGEYTLKHRLRCAMAGTFKAAPATLQSMYAPEFAAYSSGALVNIK
ncbi:MAG TPA: alpha-2-macroglobulin family protein [Candidatus Aminicenantes bacterium]|nr:alpha-2-macroglobulin family protein [Candidatus Aminicenantes bacterium]HRY65722.1 alpha-2-macroglobulin family protein [Candidatus Aminicenantes bacterium]HRZ72636.1 alpha-2-macroglobulin family protein [Candidatus Aminicenantes bacterium]